MNDDAESVENFFGDKLRPKHRKRKPAVKKKAAQKPKAKQKRSAGKSVDAVLRELSSAGRKKVRPARPDKSKLSGPPSKPITISKPDNRNQLQELEWFFGELGTGNSTIYVGIDPGASGAIGLIHPTKSSRHTALDMPTSLQEVKGKKTKKGNKPKRTVYDITVLWEYFKIIEKHKDRVLVCIEKMQPRNVDTPLTGFSMGAAYYMWPLFLYSHGIAFEAIVPSVWKRRMGLNGQNKEGSRFMAQQLFPSAPLFRKGDDGRAEALLIAETIKRRRESESAK